jgi:hypothetical protein
MVSFGVSGGGSIDSKGRFTAGNTAGTYAVTATAQDGSARASTPVSVTSATTSSTTGLTTPSNAAILFADDFSSGNLSKAANGWSWSGAYVDVVHGFSKDGDVGYSARFKFNGNPDLTADAWSELRFKVGTPNLSDLWITFWLYYPSGTEAISRGPRFVHRRGVNDAATNNKFFRLFHTYQAGYLEVGAETWSQSTPGDGDVQTFARTSSVPAGQQFWTTHTPEEVDSLRGRWLKFELHSKAASAAGVRDGVLQIYRNGYPIIDQRDLDIYPSLGENVFREGYLLGWANSGFDSTTYAYMSDVTFSTQRLP